MPPLPAAARASEPAPLRVGVVGAGRWGGNLIRTFHKLPTASLEIVCDQDAARLAGVVECEVTREFERVLSHEQLDAVAIATPPATHASLTIRALHAGLHVFVEKPMATQLSHAVRVRDAAQLAQRRVMVGYVLDHHPAVVALTTLLGSDALGTPLAVLARRGGGRRPGASHPPWWSLAPHDISLAQRVFGTRTSVVRASEAEGVQRAELQFACDRRAHLSIEPDSASRHRMLIVIGTRGSAVFDDLEPQHKLKLYSLRLPADVPLMDAERRLAHEPFLAPALTGEEPLRRELEHFVQALQNGEPFVSDLDDAVDVVSVLACGEQSILTGHAAAVPVPCWRTLPAQEAFGRSSSSRP